MGDYANFNTGSRQNSGTDFYIGGRQDSGTNIYGGQNRNPEAIGSFKEFE
jgi:hypothetical protein